MFNYSTVGRNGRPVLNMSKPIAVEFGLGLIQMDLDEKNKILSTSMWSRYVSASLDLRKCNQPPYVFICCNTPGVLDCISPADQGSRGRGSRLVTFLPQFRLTHVHNVESHYSVQEEVNLRLCPLWLNLVWTHTREEQGALFQRRGADCMS